MFCLFSSNVWTRCPNKDYLSHDGECNPLASVTNTLPEHLVTLISETRNKGQNNFVQHAKHNLTQYLLAPESYYIKYPLQPSIARDWDKQPLFWDKRTGTEITVFFKKVAHTFISFYNFSYLLNSHTMHSLLLFCRF